MPGPDGAGPKKRPLLLPGVLLTGVLVFQCAGFAQGQSGGTETPRSEPSRSPGAPTLPSRGPLAPSSPEEAPLPQDEASDDWSVHFQATGVGQGHGGFYSAYQGINSLDSQRENAMSFTSTLFLGRRLWEGAAVYADPEVAGGTGLSRTLGMAGFPNGEITRVSVAKPIPYIARLYVEQTFDLGGAEVKVEPGPNQLAERTTENRLTLRAGKFSAADVFDDNKYSHDPREQFLNWSLMENGAWDYPADTRGYTGGVAAELTLKEWTLRYGFFMMPKVANGQPLDFTFQDAHGQALEVDHSHLLFERPGIVRAMVFANNGDMGNYRKTINTPADNMDVTLSRGRDRLKYGFGLNAEQELTDDLGLFARAGWNDGRTESFAFTEIDRTVSLGASLKGTLWRRPQDTFAMALVVNGLSPDHEAYLARGGHGFILGDGALNYGVETIGEVYYQVVFKENLALSLDWQIVANPGYNQARGPIPAIWAIRVHVMF